MINLPLLVSTEEDGDSLSNWISSNPFLFFFFIIDGRSPYSLAFLFSILTLRSSSKVFWGSGSDTLVLLLGIFWSGLVFLLVLLVLPSLTDAALC